MKVVAFNGSPKKEGNTYHLIKMVIDELKDHGIETEIVQLGGKKLHGCTACGKCKINQDQKCSINNDIINVCIAKMLEADGMIIGSPTYFSNVTTEVKALIDRAGYVGLVNGYLFKRKVGAGVVAVRRAGSTDVFDAINKLFLINQMIVPGSRYWNLGMGLNEGEVLNDQEGIKTMQVLGENMAWLLKKLHS